MIQDVFRNLNKIYRHFREYRWHFAGVFVLSLIYSLLAGVGIAAFIPVFKLSQTDNAEGFSRIGQAFNAAFRYMNVEPSLANIFILIVAFLLLRFLTFTGYQLIIQYATAHYKKNTIDELTEQLLNTRWDYFQNQNKGSLLDYMTTRIVRVRRLMRVMSKLFVSYTVALGYLITAFWISSTLTVLAVSMTIITVGIMIPLAGRTKQISQTSMESQNQISRLLSEFMHAFREIKIYHIYSDIRDKIEQQTDANARAEMKVGLLQNLSREAFMVAIGLALLGSVYFTLAETTIGFEQLGPFGLLFLLIFQRINKLDKVQRLAEFSPSINVLEDLSAELQNHAETSVEKPHAVADSEFSFNTCIQFERVSFTYERTSGSDENDALRNVDLAIPRGTVTSFVGRSGAGKSTFIGLLLGLLRPTSGEVRIDGKPLTEIGVSVWRSRISYVPQDPFLLNDTISQNISLYRDVSRTDIRTAARNSQCHEFISDLPDGYETVIGEEGIKLSGGQRQRLVLARAIAGSPDVLVLDEATSELDSISETSVQQAILQLSEDMTIISVSHHLTQLFDSDQIYVLKDGSIVEEGTREELHQKQGHFYRLHELEETTETT